MWILLVALLDLGTPGVTGAPRDLTVQLTLDRGYRITHRYSGDGPRRFVTGATDKNCDEPVDVLVIDGAVTPLYGELPCGGFAYRDARTLKPGEEWTIRGSLSLREGNHTVVARYCPTPASLREVDPKVKSAAGPPWWLGCVDSAPARLSIKD